MEFEVFKNNILEQVKQCPKEWRKGQSVFNIIDDTYGVARTIQFRNNIDCFFDDSKIDDFIQAAYNILNNK